MVDAVATYRWRAYLGWLSCCGLGSTLLGAWDPKHRATATAEAGHTLAMAALDCRLRSNATSTIFD